MSSTCSCSKEFVDEREEKLKEVINKYRGVRGALIPVLHEAQEIYGYLPFHVQKIISQELQVPMSEIYGVITFYTQFSLVPKGKYQIQVCLGTACYVKGAKLVLEKFKEILGIDVGGCTEDGLFSLQACRCVGACGLAPVVMINEDVYGQMKPSEVERILKKYQNE